MKRQLMTCAALLTGAALAAQAEVISIETEQGVVRSSITSPTQVDIAPLESDGPGANALYIYDEGGATPTQGLGSYGAVGWVVSQSLTPPINATVTVVGGGFAKNGFDDCTVRFEIQSDDGGGNPSGVALGSTASIDVIGMPAYPNFTTAHGALNPPVSMIAGETYHIVYHTDVNANFVVGQSTGTFPYGNAAQTLDGGVTWTQHNATDLYFGVVY